MRSLGCLFPETLGEVGHDFLGEEAQGLGGDVPFHARPLRTEYQFIHALIFVSVDFLDALFGTADDEAAVQHLLERHIDPVG